MTTPFTSYILVEPNQESVGGWNGRPSPCFESRDTQKEVYAPRSNWRTRGQRSCPGEAHPPSGRFEKTSLLSATEETELALELRRALEEFFQHMTGSIVGIEVVLDLAAEAIDQKRGAISPDDRLMAVEIMGDCRRQLSEAHDELDARGWLPSDRAFRLKALLLDLAVKLRIRVVVFLRVFETRSGCGAVLSGQGVHSRGPWKTIFPIWRRDPLDGHDLESFWKTAARLYDRYIQIRNRFVKANLGLVAWAASRINRPDFSQADMIQDGTLGLIKAVESYDAGKNCRFSSFAGKVIRSEINRAYSNTGRLIRLPVYQCEALGKLKSAEKELDQKLERSPTVAELAEEAGLRASTVEELWSWRNPILSLDAPVGTESEITLADTLVDKWSQSQDLAASTAISLVERGLQTLPALERQLLCLRHGLEGALPGGIKTAAERLGLSVAIAQALEAKAVEHLRRSIRKGPEGFEWNE